MRPERTRNHALWALAGSLALHGVALWSLLPGRTVEPVPLSAPANATRVVLFDVASAPGAASAPALAPKSFQPGPVRSRPSRAPRVPDAPAPDAPAPQEPDLVQASVSEEAPSPANPPSPNGDLAVSEGGAEPVSGLAVVLSTEAESSSGGGRATGGASGGEGSPPAVTALHQRLAAAALRCYPDAARRFRARGEVVLSFCLDPAGNPREVARVASSGSVLLDRAATDCVLPGALPVPGAAGCYRVPVVFGKP